MRERPPCKRCLLRELDGEYFRSIYQYIENLPPEQKAGEEICRARLALCRDCSFLQNGMCALCGCFVEVRAAKAALGCPDGRWGPEDRGGEGQEGINE